MNINIYNPPEVWTEELLLSVSDEDNRYEFKSGQPWLTDEFQKKLAKEICALANSFGGTVFVGVTNEKKEIVGIPKKGNGKQSSKEWLERVIPNFLEFRLPNFRVSKVELTSETQNTIGDNVVIAVDVYDSDLAPHRSLKDGIYYFRQSSISESAPHHYLAYLWGRSNPNMGNVVNTWFKKYFNDLIYFLTANKEHFSNNNFEPMGINLGISNIWLRDLRFFDFDKWRALNSSLTAKQFLRTFPSVNLAIDEFTIEIKSFLRKMEELKSSINDSDEFEQAMRQIYKIAKQNDGYPNAYDEKASFDEVLFYCMGKFETSISGIGNYPDDFRKMLVKMTLYSLLDLDLTIDGGAKPVIFNYATDYIVPTFKDSSSWVTPLLNELKIVQEEIAGKSNSMLSDFEELRDNLALKHNTTYD